MKSQTTRQATLHNESEFGSVGLPPAPPRKPPVGLPETGDNTGAEPWLAVSPPTLHSLTSPNSFAVQEPSSAEPTICDEPEPATDLEEPKTTPFVRSLKLFNSRRSTIHIGVRTGLNPAVAALKGIAEFVGYRKPPGRSNSMPVPEERDGEDGVVSLPNSVLTGCVRSGGGWCADMRPTCRSVHCDVGVHLHLTKALRS